MTATDALRPLRRLLIGHGALLMFIGGVIGFGFLFHLIGAITLWPFPGTIAFQMPGSYKAWRMSHLEALMNGSIIWLVAALLPHLPFSITGLRRLSYGIIVTGWTLVAGALFDALFPNSRGLAANSLLTNNIAFGLFYVGILIVMAILALIAWRSLRPEPPSP
jgi:hypothetical protein